MKRSQLLFSLGLLILLSCTNNVRDWKGGSIRKTGNYVYRDSLSIEVDIEDNLVKYKMKDGSGNELLRNKYDFSNLHRWVLYLDEDKTLWVFSSDIGDGIWKWDPKTNRYIYSPFDHHLTGREVPRYLYNDLKDYFD